MVCAFRNCVVYALNKIGQWTRKNYDKAPL